MLCERRAYDGYARLRRRSDMKDTVRDRGLARKGEGVDKGRVSRKGRLRVAARQEDVSECLQLF